MTESQIQQDILKSAYGHPAIKFLYRNNIGSAKGANGRWIRYGVGGKGASDLLGMTQGGVFLACEVKTPKGVVSPEQAEFIEYVRKGGGIAFVATSRDEFDRLLTQHINHLAIKRQKLSDDPF